MLVIFAEQCGYTDSLHNWTLRDGYCKTLCHAHYFRKEVGFKVDNAWKLLAQEHHSHKIELKTYIYVSL